MDRPNQEYLDTLTPKTREYIAELEALAQKNAAEIKRLRSALSFYADESEWYCGASNSSFQWRLLFNSEDESEWYCANSSSQWRLLFNSTDRDGHGYEVAKEALAGGEE